MTVVQSCPDVKVIPELALHLPALYVGEVERLWLTVSAGLTAGSYQDDAGPLVLLQVAVEVGDVVEVAEHEGGV